MHFSQPFLVIRIIFIAWRDLTIEILVSILFLWIYGSLSEIEKILYKISDQISFWSDIFPDYF